MSAALLMLSLLVSGQGQPNRVRVYRFVDKQGMEHFVDQLDQVPEGLKPTPVDLDDVTLNPETAKALADAANHANKPKGTSAASSPASARSERPPPADAGTFLMWAVALTVAFLGLALLKRATEQQMPQVSFALGIVRFAAGSLALMSWAATAYEYRDSHRWLSEHFPPLQALDRAVRTKEKVERLQKQQEQDIDRGLRGEKQ